jgi:hypothetical protein
MTYVFPHVDANDRLVCYVIQLTADYGAKERVGAYKSRGPGSRWSLSQAPPFQGCVPNQTSSM